MKKIINIDLAVEYFDHKDEKQAELTAAMIEWYFMSDGGKVAMADFIGNTVRSLVKSGVVISEGTA